MYMFCPNKNIPKYAIHRCISNSLCKKIASKICSILLMHKFSSKFSINMQKSKKSNWQIVIMPASH